MNIISVQSVTPIMSRTSSRYSGGILGRLAQEDMGRIRRHYSKEDRLRRRALRKQERQPRPLTPGERVVLRHLLRPMIDQRHCSIHPYIYHRSPNCVNPFIPRGLQGRQSKLSRELARRAEQWVQQIPALRVYCTACLMCQPPCFAYVRMFVPHIDVEWPDGLILHVDLDAPSPGYAAVVREIGRKRHDSHLISSRDLERVQAVIILEDP